MHGLHHTDDKGIITLQKVGNYLPKNAAHHPRKDLYLQELTYGQ
jgi:hypothetical protein